MYGILFDLDGTLADSDSIHFQAWQKILGEINVNKPLIDREFYDRNISGRENLFERWFWLYIGRFNVDITRALLPDLSEDERMQIGEKKDVLFRQFAQEKLQPTKGLDRIIEYIQQNRSKLKIGKRKEWKL